jgi:hypothetical protein
MKTIVIRYSLTQQQSNYEFVVVFVIILLNIYLLTNTYKMQNTTYFVLFFVSKSQSNQSDISLLKIIIKFEKIRIFTRYEAILNTGHIHRIS